jgi:hypothetical protein
VKSTSNLSVARLPRLARAPVCCDIIGHGSVEVTPEQFPALRQAPGRPVGEPLAASFMKHLDEQTVAALAAVSHAVHDHALVGTDFTDWAILGAPRYLGRQALAVALQRYQLEGAWGISPHLIPHRSLHSVSGTVSQVLKVHGPNFGVSGGLHAADEALLTGATLLAGDHLPGVWLVLTGYNPEPVPEKADAPPPNGHPRPAPICRAVALALVANQPGSGFRQLHVCPGPVDNGRAGLKDRGRPWFCFEDLATALRDPTPARAWRLHCGGTVEVKWPGAGAEIKQ